MTTIALSRPILFEGNTYTTLTMDEPTVGGVAAAEKVTKAGGAETDATIAMLAYELGWPEGAVRKMALTDFQKVVAALAPFVEGTGGTGA